jgi:hypothetical protein
MQAVLEVEGLPHAALDAAAVFHAEHLQHARAALAGEVEALALVFPEAPYDHSPWRKAVVADLARAAAPKRVNAVTGNYREAIDATLAWLEQASGITGQVLAVDGTGAGNPAS